MEKDGRYKKIKPLFRARVVQSFSEIFLTEIIPKTLLAGDLKKNNDQITKLIKTPGGFKIKDVIRIRELFELMSDELIELFALDHHDDFEIDRSKKHQGYKHVRTMWEDGSVKGFNDIFDHVPMTTVAKDIGKRKGKFALVRLTYTEVARIAKLSELSLTEIFQLINYQLKTTKKKK